MKVLFDDGVHDAVQGTLHKGEMVITDGQLRVLPGAKVDYHRLQRKAAGAGKGPMTSGRRRVPHAQDHEG